jgi:eukaryotic-like serine/threonine-protein kinase
LLETALSYYQEFIDQRRDDPRTEAVLEATRDQVGKIIADLAVMKGSWQHMLLGEPAVQRELRLSGEQRERIGRVLGDVGKCLSDRGFPRLTEQERSQALIDEVAAHEAAIADTLKPDQLHRLRQIALQIQGPAAFREKKVLAALKLTAEQQAQIRAIEEETSFGMRGFHHPGPGSRGPHGGRDEGFREAGQRIQAVLTDAQRQQWREMTGEPFAEAARYARGRFGPPGDRPRGGRPGAGPMDDGFRGGRGGPPFGPGGFGPEHGPGRR